MKTVNIAVINDVSLQVVVDDREQLIPIKPVCIPQRGTVAADGKEREMLCLPSNLAA